METLEIVNQRLDDYYGKGFNGLPKYRVVWSTTEIERRAVWFTPSGIQLDRPISMDVSKYPQDKDRWILEQVLPNIGNPELHGTYSYEPLWVFSDKNNDYIDYDWEILEKVIYFHIHRQAPKTPQMLEHEEEEKKLKEQDEVLDLLKHDEAMPDRMYDTPIVTVPHNYKGRDDV
jgi:hypothetical protein